MSAVDVLAVMRQLARLAFEAGAYEGPDRNEPAYRLHQNAVAAVDAVAELIERLPDPETLKRCMEAGSREYGQKWRESVASGKERTDFYDKSVALGVEAGYAAAALARVGGAS